MQTHFDGKSGSGHQLPTGGETLGNVADAFWLKGMFTKENAPPIGEKTARRYFNGQQETVGEESVRAIVEHLIESFFPHGYFARRIDEEQHDIRTTIADVVTGICTGWDVISGGVNGYRFPNKDPGLAVLPALRLAAFDGAIRWGAWSYLRRQPDKPGDNDDLLPLPWWLQDNCVKAAFDKYRLGGQNDPTLKEIADEAGFSQDDITNWRAGKHRPKPQHLDVIGQTLCRHAPDAMPEDVIFELRVATGTTYLRGKLEELCEKERIEDLLVGVRLIAQYTSDTLASLNLDSNHVRGIAGALLMEGARGHAGIGICHSIRSSATGSSYVADDIAALPHDWTPRLQYWAKMLAEDDAEGTADQIGLLSSLGITASPETITGIVREVQLRVRDFLAPPQLALARILHAFDFNTTHQLNIHRDGLKQLRPFWLAIQAEAEFSVGNVAGSIELLEAAIAEQPENAHFHFSLGCRLGQLSTYQLDPEPMHRAIEECHIASALDPEWGRPRNEIGVILSNNRRFNAAEEAFEKAGPYNEEWHQHHLNRGQNLMWLERYEDAIACFERSLALEPNDLRALEAKGICLLAMGDRRGGKKCLRKTARITGRDLLRDDRWKEVLDGPGTHIRMSHPVSSSTE